MQMVCSVFFIVAAYIKSRVTVLSEEICTHTTKRRSHIDSEYHFPLIVVLLSTHQRNVNVSLLSAPRQSYCDQFLSGARRLILALLLAPLAIGRTLSRLRSCPNQLIRTCGFNETLKFYLFSFLRRTVGPVRSDHCERPQIVSRTNTTESACLVCAHSPSLGELHRTEQAIARAETTLNRTNWPF